MKRFTTKLMAVASLALVLTLSGSSNAQFEPEAPKTISLIGGFWVAPLNGTNGAEGYLAMKFNEDGSVAVAKLDSQAKPVGVKRGSYRIDGNVIQVTVDGQSYGLKYSVVNNNKITLDGRPCIRITQ